MSNELVGPWLMHVLLALVLALSGCAPSPESLAPKQSKLEAEYRRLQSDAAISEQAWREIERLENLIHDKNVELTAFKSYLCSLSDNLHRERFEAAKSLSAKEYAAYRGERHTKHAADSDAIEAGIKPPSWPDQLWNVHKPRMDAYLSEIAVTKSQVGALRHRARKAQDREREAYRAWKAES